MSDSSQSPRDPSGGVGVGESDRGESEGLLKLRAVVRLQSAMRRFRDRVRVVRILRSRFEKIYDIKRSRFYYYDQITDISSWRKPRLFRKQDVQFVSPMYTPQTAAETVQKHMRRYMALMRVRLLYQSRVSAVPDARTGGTYYYNSYEGQAMWELPKFMKGRLNHKRRADRRPGDSESESDGGSGNESDSEAEKLRRKMARKMPRSKIQLLVDAAEDDWASKEIHMDLSGFQSAYISSRIYDVAALHTLNLENNKITKLSDQISYLSKLQVLNVRNNRLAALPKEIGECKFLRIVLLGGNLLTTLPANFFLLGRLIELELSGNPMAELPIITGDMYLLKILKDWEVGVSAFRQLKSLLCSDSQLKQWPPQVDRISKLEHMDFSRNALVRAPESIARNGSLTHLDLSHNQLVSIPPEIYGLPLQVLKLNNNKLSEFPDPSEVRTGTFIRGDHLVELDISENSIEQVSAWIQLYSSLARFYASENKINLLSQLMGGNIFIRELDMNRCLLYKIPEELGHCTLIVKLYLENNQLGSIPVELSHLMVLQELRLSHNVLTALPSEVFECKPALRVLTVENNLLSELPPSVYVLPALTFLDASYNRLEVLPDDLGQCASLRTLLLGDNCIPALPASVADCAGLVVLEIHNNRLHSLPGSMAKLIQLRRLTIHGNCLGPNIPAVLSDLKTLPFYNISNNNIASKLLQLDPISGFSAACRDIRMVSVYVSAVWSVLRAAPGLGHRQTDEGSLRSVGGVCSACNALLAGYFPSSIMASGQEAEAMKEYLVIMEGLVVNMSSDKENLTLASYVNVGERQRGVDTLHTMDLEEFVFPSGACLDNFLLGLQAFQRFSDAARALYSICMRYCDDYESWKLRMNEPDLQTEAKSVPSFKAVSPKGKPKTVSFRKNFSSKSVKSIQSMAEGAMEAADRVDNALEVPATLEPVYITPPTKLDITDISSVAKRLRANDIFEGVPPPPQGSQLPLMAEAALRSMLQQRQRPHHEDTKKSARTVYSTSEDPLTYLLVLVDCYSGLGTSLIRMADFLCSLLRTIEERGSVKPSCLSVCQRINDDFDDLMGEKAGAFARKKFNAPGSGGKAVHKENILAQLKVMSANSEGKIADIPVVGEANNNTGDEPQALDPNCPLDHKAACATAVDIENQRRRVLLLAAVFLDRALFILKCCGWDAKSMKMQNSVVSSRRAVHHFGAMDLINTAIHVGFYYGMALQKLRICSTAVREYYAVLSLGPLLVWHPLQLEIVKCYLEMGEYLKAEELLYIIIDNSPSWHLRSDKSIGIGPLNAANSNLSREVRMLGAMLSSAFVSLQAAGLGAKEQINRFELESTGTIQRRPLVATEILIGRTDRLYRQIAEMKYKEKEAFAQEKIELDRAAVLTRVKEAIFRANAVVQQHEEFVEQMGPIVMPE